MNFTTEGRDELHDEISADIADNCFIPMCCDNMSIEVVIAIIPGIIGIRAEFKKLQHVCVNCGSLRPELD